MKKKSMESCSKIYCVCNRVLNNIILHLSTTPDLAAILKKGSEKFFLLISRLELTLEENVLIHKIFYKSSSTHFCDALCRFDARGVKTFAACFSYPHPPVSLFSFENCLPRVSFLLYSGLGQTVNVHWQSYYPCTQTSIQKLKLSVAVIAILGLSAQLEVLVSMIVLGFSSWIA